MLIFYDKWLVDGWLIVGLFQLNYYTINLLAIPQLTISHQFTFWCLNLRFIKP